MRQEGTDLRGAVLRAATGRRGDMVRPAADRRVGTDRREGVHPEDTDRQGADLRVVTGRPAEGPRWAVRRDTARRVTRRPDMADLRPEASGRRVGRPA